MSFLRLIIHTANTFCTRNIFNVTEIIGDTVCLELCEGSGFCFIINVIRLQRQDDICFVRNQTHFCFYMMELLSSKIYKYIKVGCRWRRKKYQIKRASVFQYTYTVWEILVILSPTVRGLWKKLWITLVFEWVVFWCLGAKRNLKQWTADLC